MTLSFLNGDPPPPPSVCSFSNYRDLLLRWLVVERAGVRAISRSAFRLPRLPYRPEFRLRQGPYMAYRRPHRMPKLTICALP